MRGLNPERLIPALFAVSAFSLIWRGGSPKPFELLISLTILIVAISVFYSSSERVLLKKIWLGLRRYRILIALLLLFTIVGSLYSVSAGQGIFTYKGEVLLEYVRLLFAIVLFFLTAYVVNRYKTSSKLMLGAIAASPVVLLVAFYPRWQNFFVDNTRLIGARNDPNYLASFIALGLVIGAAYFLYKKTSKRWFGMAGIFLITPLFLWAGSRAAFLSIVITYVILVVVYLKQKMSPRALLRSVLLVVLFTVFFSASFFILPRESQDLIRLRTTDTFISGLLSANDTGVDYPISAQDGFDYSRGDLWKDGLSTSLRSPLGLGPAYHNWSPIGEIGRPHNLWLEATLVSGWAGFIVWVLFISFVSRDAWSLIRKGSFIEVSLAGSFIYLLINGLFLDMFTLRWLWLIMGVIVGYTILIKNEDTKSISSSSDI